MTRRASALSPALDRDPTVLRVREPGDILGVIPYLLGFHPEESLVATFVRQRRVAVTARIDLAAVADLDGLIDQLEQVGDQVATQSVVLVGYSADESVRELMRNLVELIPLDLVDVLAVSGDRWWSVTCTGSCCPSEGRPYDVASHPLAAAAVVAGISATASRSEIAALTAGPAADDRARLTDLTQEWAGRLRGMSLRRRRRRIKQLVDRVLDAGGPSEAEAVEIAVLVRDLVVRDDAWALMTRPRAEDHVNLWRRVVSVAVEPWSAAPLGMLAIAGWLSGNGALLNCCIDRLEETAPDYTLLSVCRAISDQAVPPSRFDVIAAEMRAGQR